MLVLHFRRIIGSIESVCNLTAHVVRQTHETRMTEMKHKRFRREKVGRHGHM